MPATTSKPKPFPEAEKNGNGGGGREYERPTFVRCDLSADQKREMAEWANSRSADDLLDMVTKSVEEGYTLSCKTAEQGFQASLTMPGPAKIGKKNTGKSLVTRASSPERVLWSLYYKHTQVMEEDWSRGNEEALMDW